jgi:WD40 repeat protein
MDAGFIMLPFCLLSIFQLFDLQWNEAGTKIVAGSTDSQVRVWNVMSTSTAPAAELKGHSSAVNACAWDPSGNGMSFYYFMPSCLSNASDCVSHWCRRPSGVRVVRSIAETMGFEMFV